MSTPDLPDLSGPTEPSGGTDRPPDDAASLAPEREAPAVLRFVDRLLPRAVDLGPAALGVLVAFVPVAALRAWVALGISPLATWRELLVAELGEVSFWVGTLAVATILLRLTPARLHGAVRVAFHAFCSIVMVFSLVELVYLHVTGGRIDVELIVFGFSHAREVLPVVLSEVKPWQGVAVLVGIVAGFAPMFVRFAPARTWSSRFGLLLAVPVLLTELGGRPVAAKALRILQPSLAEGLYYDALDSLEDRTIPPSPAELEPVRVSRAPEAPRPPNVVLVFLESVGAHNTSLFDAPLDTTPNLVRLANEGVWVRDQTTVVPHTSKSITASLCGQVPWLKTEIEEARLGSLPGRCLPALLSDLGYRTAFFQTADESFERRAELTHFMGFGFFRARDSLKRGGYDKVNYFGIEDRAMLDPGLAWSQASDTPFFATYLTLTSHHDYGVPRDFPRRNRYAGASGRRMKHLDAVRYVDTFVGELVAAYKDAGLADNTLFILHGDHGEGFNEHGRSQHDLVIWEEGLHVPMVLWGPGVLGGRTGVIEGPRTSFDVLPTVLDAIGARVDAGYLPGASLLQDVPKDRTVHHSCWRSHRCLAAREGDDKFIDHYRDRGPQVFDLSKDPKERKDLARSRTPAELSTRSEEARSWRARVNGRLLALREGAREALQVPDSSPAVARFGGAMDALGCTVDTPVVVPGESLWLSCRWRLGADMDNAWRASVRVRGGPSTIEEDHAPLDGQLPTFTWKPGHAVTDPVRVKIPTTARPTELTIEVGWERYGGSAIAMDAGGTWLRAGTARVVKPSWGRTPPVTRSAAP